MAKSQSLPDPSALESSDLMRFASRADRRAAVHAHHAPSLRPPGTAAPDPVEASAAGDAVVFVGGSGRYRLGELLRPAVAKHVLGVGRSCCAGLVGRDLSAYGAEPLHRYDRCEEALGSGYERLHLLHLGGDLIAGDLLDRYALAASGEEAERFASLRTIGDEAAVRDYVARRTGFSGPWPGLLEAEGAFFGAQVGFLGVDLADPERLSRAESRDLARRLAESRFLGVRGATAADWLEEQGLEVRRMPCPLSILPDHVGSELHAAKDSDALAAMRHRFPDGWIAVEIGSVPPEHRRRLRDALRQAAEDASLGLVFFDASLAGRDDRDRCAWWLESLGDFSAACFPSKQAWEVAAMLLAARAYIGWDLDCRMLAMSGSVARLDLPGASRSQLGYTALWEDAALAPEASESADWAEAVAAALAIPPAALERHAMRLRGACYEGIAACRDACRMGDAEPGALEGSQGRRSEARRIAASSSEHRARAARLRHLHDEWLEKAAAWHS